MVSAHTRITRPLLKGLQYPPPSRGWTAASPNFAILLVEIPADPPLGGVLAGLAGGIKNIPVTGVKRRKKFGPPK